MILPRSLQKKKYSAATQIVVSEYDSKEQKIKIVERVEIPSTEFTFDNAVEKIVELNNFWQPQKIYLDRGYGEYQVETLKKRIGSTIVTGIAFNESIEVVDPTDRTVSKKMAKHFMVNQTAILLERDQIQISENDREVYKQLINYRVVKKSSSGKPIYTSENEHALDAFMLTILCYTIEFPEIAKVLEKREFAKNIAKLNKKITSNKEEDIFKGKFKNYRHEQNDDLEGEPDYVKEMMTLKKVNNGGRSGRGFSRSRSSWSSRGRGKKSRSPGRGSF